MRHGHEVLWGDIVVEHARPQCRVRLVLEVLVETADLGAVLFFGFRTHGVVRGDFDGYGFREHGPGRFRGGHCEPIIKESDAAVADAIRCLVRVDPVDFP